MALLVDGNISSLKELQAYDSRVLEAAQNEGVSLEQKLQLAYEQISLEVSAFLLKHRERVPQLPGGEPDLRAVVVTSGLRLWNTLRTLALVYADAYHNQVSDRYVAKQRHFESNAKKAAETYFETGVGLTTDPIVRARPPEVLANPSGPATGGIYSVNVAWRNNRGERGAHSAPVGFSAAPGEGIQVRALEPPANATSFDVFAGMTEQEMTLQSQVPVSAGQWWVMPQTGLIQGTPPTSGQAADYFIRHERMLRRG
jgi:hypothetical protein